MKSRRSSLAHASLVAGLLFGVACNNQSSDTTKASADVASQKSSAPSAKVADARSSAKELDVAPSASAAASSVARADVQPPADLTKIPPNHDGILDAGVADTIVPKNGAPRVIVLDAGSEPRSELRYKVAENKKQSIGMTMKMEITMDVGGKTTAVPMPAFGINMDLSTEDRDKATGDIALVAEVKGAKIVGEPGDPRVADAMMKAMGSMNGMKMSTFVSDEGRVRDAKVSVPAGADPNGAQFVDQMKQSFNSMAQPLPHEAVGVGATWLAITRANAGADTLNYTTFHLKSRTGDKLDLETQIQQVVASPDFPAPGGMTVHVGNFSSHGTGESVLDLGEVAPEHGESKVELSMNASTQGQSVNVATKIKVLFGPPIK